MQTLIDIAGRIRAIEARAGAINMTLHGICKRAGVQTSTVSRWRDGREYKGHHAADVVGRLEQVLASEEQRVVEAVESVRRQVLTIEDRLRA